MTTVRLLRSLAANFEYMIINLTNYPAITVFCPLFFSCFLYYQRYIYVSQRRSKTEISFTNIFLEISSVVRRFSFVYHKL